MKYCFMTCFVYVWPFKHVHLPPAQEDQPSAVVRVEPFGLGSVHRVMLLEQATSLAAIDQVLETQRYKVTINSYFVLGLFQRFESHFCNEWAV